MAQWLAATNRAKAGDTDMELFEGILSSAVAGGILVVVMAILIRSKIKERKQGGCSFGCPGCNGSCAHSAVSHIEHKEENHEIK